MYKRNDPKLLQSNDGESWGDYSGGAHLDEDNTRDMGRVKLIEKNK